MSYILDALRKADAERERDPARGIHAQPLVAAPARTGAGLGRGAWIAAVVLVAAGAAYVAWPQKAPVSVPATAPAEPVRGPVVEAVPAPPLPVVTVADTVSPPAPPPLPVPAMVRPVAERAPARSEPKVAAAPAARASAPAAAAAPAPAADRILAVADLPPDLQRELPKLAISGGVHSENAAQRLLIVGGQVVNEGAELAPGVVLEQIRARTAVLRFRGYRYSVPF